MLATRNHEAPGKKKAGSGSGAKAASSEPQQLNPIWQQLATRVQTKLSVGAVDDPSEREADRIADQIMRMPEAKVQRSCAGKCEEEPAEAAPVIHRKAPEAREQTGAWVPDESISNLGLGQPLDSATRRFFEPRFGSDFSNVRIHTGKEATDSARAIQAHAYTIGDRIVFGAGHFSPDSTAGRQLLAHELTHVLQQPRSGSRDAVVRRRYDDHDTLDPENPGAWSWLRSRDLASEFWQRPFLATLSATPQAALDLEQRFGKTAPPSSDEERDRSVAEIRTLIRLNAVGLMASHRAGVTRHRDELESQTQTASGGAAQPKEGQSPAARNTSAIRAAAAETARLRQLKDTLEESEHQLRLESTSQLRVGGGSFSDALEHIDEYSREYRGPWARAYFARLAERLQGVDRIDRGTATALIFNMGRDLAGWRQNQVNGVIVSLDQLYERFPFLAHMDPEGIVGAGTDALVLERVRGAFTELLLKIDNAIADMGSGNIDPFNLPQAVKFTKESLPGPWQAVLDQAIQRHQLHEFWLGMGLTVFQMLLVFIPVVGPVLAAGLGLAQLVSTTDEMLTRYEVSEASTTVSGDVLGVQGPSAFEWAMLGVQAALTAADLAGAWKEISAVRAHFPEAEPRLVKSEIDVVPDSEAQVPPEKVMTEGAGEPAQPPPKKVATEGAGEPAQPPPQKGAVAPVEHELPDFSRSQLKRIREIENELSEFGMNWNDLGLENREAVTKFFSEQGDVDRGIRELERRMQRARDVRGVHSEAQHPETWGSRRRGTLPEREGPEVPEGQRMPRGTATPDPEGGGMWGGERGNSEWFPDNRDVIDIVGNRPIDFHNGFPDFSPWAKERVRIKVTGVDHVDFAAADRLMASRRGFANQTAYAEWRSANKLTWHHVEGAEEMILVPRALHENVPHVGGASQARTVP